MEKFTKKSGEKIIEDDMKYMFFYGGIFSNWYPSKFKVDGFKYNCGEQYMMHQKALLFGDTITANHILSEETPKMQKLLGRKVANFDTETWNTYKYDMVKKGLTAKFSQNDDLKAYLLKHKGFQMVEASPYDRVWGIGYNKKDALSNVEDWGENLLGKIITELSLELV